MYHLPWKDLPLTYWYHSQQWVNLPPSQSRKPFHLAFWIFRERFAFSGKECKRSDTTEIMICLEQNWIGIMCMSKHGNECHIVGFIQPLIQEKDFTAMVTLLVWQAIDVTENNQLAPKSETKSNNKDTQDYPLKKIVSENLHMIYIAGDVPHTDGRWCWPFCDLWMPCDQTLSSFSAV